jgi:hypothetical protein
MSCPLRARGPTFFFAHNFSNPSYPFHATDCTKSLLQMPDALNLNPSLGLVDPAFAWAAGSGCLIPSDPASTDYSIEVCPYSTSYLRARGGGARVASLGTFAGVVRQNRTDCAPDDSGFFWFAITGLLFANGDACANGTRSAQVNFVCSAAANPWADRYLANASVLAASASPDGCAWQLDVPLAGACTGDAFSLCSGLQSPSPNAVPSPVPFSFSRAFVVAWAPTSVTALAPPGGAVRAVRVQRYDGTNTALVAPLPAPLPPSASPIPAPFPSALTVLSVSPAAGLSFASDAASMPPGFSDNPCTPQPVPPQSCCTANGPVVISLGGVQPADLEGLEAGFDLTIPRGPNFEEEWNLFGTPLGAQGGVTRVPANGRLDLVLPCAPYLLDGLATPHAAQFTVRARFRAGPNNATLLTRRVAACAPGACTWTFWGPAPPAPPSAAADAALSGPALYGTIGGSLGLAALVAAGVAAYCWGCCGAAAPRGKDAAPAPPKAAWGGAAIEVNPVAVALNGSDGSGSVQEWSPK